MPLLTPQEKLMAIYNADLVANGKPTVNPADFDFSTPASYSGPRSSKTTVLYMQPKAASPSIGLATIYYNRINLATVTTLRVTKGSATDINSLLPALNAELGLAFAASDFSPVALPAAPGTFTLTATNTNLAMTGSTVVMLD